MKAGITTIILAVIVILGVYFTQNINSETVRKNDLKTSVSNACEQVMHRTKGKTYATNTEMANAFAKNLKKQISNDGEIHIQFLKVDHVEGILRVQVSQTYKTTNNKTKTITIQKTAILDQKNKS